MEKIEEEIVVDAMNKLTFLSELTDIAADSQNDIEFDQPSMVGLSLILKEISNDLAAVASGDVLKGGEGAQ